MTNASLCLQHNNIRITLLGRCTVEKDELEVQFSYAKVQAILAYLLLERRPVGREALALLFWPQMESAQGRANFRLALHTLRQALGKDVLGSNRESVWLEKSAMICCDAWDFLASAPRCKVSRLAADCELCFPSMLSAVNLYQGEFMAGFSLEECPEFEDWLHIKRRIMHRQALSLLERMISCAQEAKNPGLAIQFAERFTALEPWDEEGHRRLMTLLAEAGQLGAAAAQYGVLSQVLERELGSLPSEATRLLHEALQQAPSPVGAKAAVAPHPVSLPRQMEHGQVTVLYCELRSLGREPGDAAEALQRARAICRDLIKQKGGYVAPFHGGGVLAYFGFPEESEGAAVAAVECAHRIVETHATASLALRIGVHSGQMVYGGNDEHPDLLGEVSDMAAHLIECARSGDVVISSSVCTLLDSSFSLLPVERPSVLLREAGFQIFRALVRPGVEQGNKPSTPFLFGRNHEQDRLRKLWREVIQGTPKALLIMGEPGLGKSTLAGWLMDEVLAEGRIVRQLRCLPQHRETFLLPVIDLLMRQCRIGTGDSPEVRREKLGIFLREEYPEVPEDAGSVLAIMLGIIAPQASMDYSPGLARERTYNVLRAMLASLASRQPVLLVCEDLHCADLLTQEWLGRLIHAPVPGVLLLMTARPEFAAPWTDKLEPFHLHPLRPEDAGGLLEKLSAGALERQRIEQIVNAAEGVPLFLEQLGRAALEGCMADGQLPASLREVIGARLGKLGSARRLAQIAATIGREFDLQLLEAVSEDESADIFFAGLRMLEKSRLIHINERRHGVFNHGLIRDAAYEAQPRAIRRETHRRIVEKWLLLHPDLSERHPEWLASHHAESGDHENAIRHWQAAGNRAIAAAAYADGAIHFRAALSFLNKWPPSTALDRWALEITSALGAALVACQGYGSAEARAVFTQALELSSGLDESEDIFRPLFGLWLGASSHGDYKTSMRVASRLERAANKSGQPIHLLQSVYAYGNNYTWLGKFETARAYLERGVDLYRELEEPSVITDYGEDSGVTCLAFLSWVYWFLGEPDKARQAAADSQQLARQLQHPFSLAFALGFTARMHQLMGESHEALHAAEELIALAERHCFPLWQAAAYLFLGWGKAVQGDEAGVRMAEQSLQIVSQAMPSVEVTFLSVLADMKYRLGRHEEVISLVDQALQRGVELNDAYMRGELLRLKGHSLQLNGQPAEARRLLAQALAVAQIQGTPEIERACRSLMTFNGA